jgi:hypothetical protein
MRLLVHDFQDSCRTNKIDAPNEIGNVIRLIIAPM